MSMQSKLLPGEARSWLEKVPRVRKEEEKKAEEEEKTKSGIIERYGETGKSGEIGRAHV